MLREPIEAQGEFEGIPTAINGCPRCFEGDLIIDAILTSEDSEGEVRYIGIFKCDFCAEMFDFSPYVQDV